MLILERKINEPIYIGKDIVIVITDIGCNKIKVGIRAPKELSIKRHDMKIK